MTDFDTDIIVIGSGPTGLTTALALATYGVRVHIVSLWNWLAPTPRAHITNQRAMEVYRDLGIENEVLETATPWHLMGDTPYTTSLAGEELIRQHTWGTGDKRKGDYLKASPCPLVDCIQPKIEPILLKNAASRGATFSFNTEYVRHQQDDDGVTVHLRERLSGREYAKHARYLVAADGANSIIVEQLGLSLEGTMGRAGTVYTIFDADLSQYLQDRPSILHWIVSPDTSFGEIGLGLLRAVTPWTRWIAGWGFNLNEGKPDTSRAFVRRRIKSMIGDDNIEPKIVDTSLWYVNQAYAKHYSKGRIFCGGDAVHRHPPSSGLGLNTCVQDAFNLAWKLAYVVRGFAGQALLESYSDERAPVGKQVVQRANQSRLDYAPLNACFRVEGADNPVAEGIKRFRDPGPQGKATREKLLDALKIKEEEFNALGTELNQRYRSSAVLADTDATEEDFENDSGEFLRPSTRPGAKLPHTWLINRKRDRVSTLDIVGQGKFTVLTGLSGHYWAAAAKALDLPFLRTVVIGAEDVRDLYFNWPELSEIEEDGVLLVRPDGYVCWRVSRGVSDLGDAETQLLDALRRVLSIPQMAEKACTPMQSFGANFEPKLFE